MRVLPLVRLTVADAVRQPVTWIVTGLSLALLALSYGFGMFNFEAQDRLRMLATAGVAVSVINGLFLGVILASTMVHDELANRTAVTIFAKPLARSDYLVGKAVGVWVVVCVSCLLIACAHAGVVAYAAHGESPEHHHDEDGHDHDHSGWGEDRLWVPWAALTAAHLLGLAHAGVLVAMACSLALRLPLAGNIIACFAVFVGGHALAGLGYAGALLVPALALFNIDDAIQLQHSQWSWASVAGSCAYAATFAAGCLFLALATFKRQDIA